MKRSVDTPQKALRELKKLVEEVEVLLQRKELAKAKAKVLETLEVADFLLLAQLQRRKQARLRQSLLASEGHNPKQELEKLKKLMVRNQKEMEKIEYRIEIGTVRQRLIEVIQVLEMQPMTANRFNKKIPDPYYGQANKALDTLGVVIAIIERYDIQDVSAEDTNIFSVIRRVDNYGTGRTNIPTN